MQRLSRTRPFHARAIPSSDLQQSSAWSRYSALLDLRVKNFSKDSPVSDGSFTYEKTMNVSRNFIYLVPELADELAKGALEKVRAAVQEYHEITPCWFVSKYDRTYGEGTFQPLYDYHALFQARARILKEPFAELAKYIDVPAFWRGDLFYIQNLVAALTVAPPSPDPDGGTTKTDGGNTPPTDGGVGAGDGKSKLEGSGCSCRVIIAGRERSGLDGSALLPMGLLLLGVLIAVCRRGRRARR